MKESLLSRLDDEEARKFDKSRDISVFQEGPYSILVGRNSESNDALVSMHGHPKCVWMHIEEGGGAHVILCLEGKPEPSEEVFRFAGYIAKRFSKSESMRIRYAYLDNVYKPIGCGVGIWKARTIAFLDLKE